MVHSVLLSLLVSYWILVSKRKHKMALEYGGLFFFSLFAAVVSYLQFLKVLLLDLFLHHVHWGVSEMRWMPYSASSLRMALPSYFESTSNCCWTPLSPPHFSPCFHPSTSPWLNPHPPTKPATNWTWSSLETAPHPTLRGLSTTNCLLISYRTTCLILTNLGSRQTTPERLLCSWSLRLCKWQIPNLLPPSSSSSTCQLHFIPWTTRSCSHLSSRWESLDLH
ncbi:hypothetical protein AAFF_G00228230 [Aldrovandia affinis]|uniref:Uncharacterized protein n=1 Tax=Aldrovandia affinis TaxID=143900 RepID=A0AAD7WU75_9TELE|nr:hypothetical protein AAFF_G00228230 [Aldrovandia affinis]